MSPPDELDEGWDDGPDAGPDDGGDAGSEGAAASGDATGAASGDTPRRKRRRRRRRREGDGPQERLDASDRQPPSQPESQSQSQPPLQSQPESPSEQEPQPQSRRQRQRRAQRDAQSQPPRPSQAGQPQGGEQAQRQGGAQGQRQPQQQRQGGAQGPRGRGERRERHRERRSRDPRESLGALAGGGEHDLRHDDDILRGDPYALRDDAAKAARGSQPTIDPVRGSHPTIDPLRGSHGDDDEVASDAPAVAWGTEDDSPAPAVALAPDLPVEPPAGDPDPLTYPLVDGPGAQLGDDVASVVGVRFVTAGRIQWCDAGDAEFQPGERVLVDSDRGQRLAWIATAPMRRSVRDRSLRRVIRRANDMDLRGERDGEADRAHALRVAKDVAATLRLPLKVFRVEKTGTKLNVYYTSDERLDLRDFVREVGQATGLRLELRQLGVRDEAKMVGGIGSCGLTLCCSTWLPEFVPVSIKMAKDQGLVLSPTKVSGQCGRLKCCLVYEQAGYAELRKGLPKLGKRVVSHRGEGRVVEVDVLRQRVRVSYGAGDTEVLPASEVKPMFPSGNQPREPEPADPDDADDHLPPS